MPDEPASYIATGAVHRVHIVRCRLSLSLNSLGGRGTTLRSPASSGRAGPATWGTGRLQGGAEPITLPAAAADTWAVARMLSRTATWLPAATKPAKLRRAPRAPRRPPCLFILRSRSKTTVELMRTSDVPADDMINYGGSRLPLQQ